MFRVLSIDGGGIRGIIPAMILKDIASKLGETRKLHECFDLIVGTSTGAILAAGVALDIELDEIVSLYKEHGQEIFPPPGSVRSKWFNPLESLVKPRYSPKPMEEVLTSIFSVNKREQLLSESKTKLLITSYDVFNRQAFFMRSYEPRFEQIKVWEACKASSSAPVYFPAHELNFDGAKLPLIDGGLVANNPAACALAEAIAILGKNSLHETQDLVLTSFGTGQLTRRIENEEAQKWGGIEWIIPVIDVLMDGTSEATNLICQKILRDENFFRIQVRLDDASDSIDDASTRNIDNLSRIASAFLSSTDGQNIVKRVVDKLME